MLNGVVDGTGRKARARASQRALVAEESFVGPTRGRLREGVEGAMYSIRIPLLALGVQCPTCGQSFWASGPTGYENETPICDACLLESCHPLGMLLALGLITRQLAKLSPREGGDYDGALREVGIFAQVYEQVAALDGPPRRFELPQKYRRGQSDAPLD